MFAPVGLLQYEALVSCRFRDLPCALSLSSPSYGGVTQGTPWERLTLIGHATDHVRFNDQIDLPRVWFGSRFWVRLEQQKRRLSSLCCGVRAEFPSSRPVKISRGSATSRTHLGSLQIWVPFLDRPMLSSPLLFDGSHISAVLQSELG